VRYFFDSKKRYLFLLPVVILLLNVLVGQYAFRKTETTMLKEKLIEVTNSIDVLAAGIESDTERPWYEHEQRIIGSVEFLDGLYQVYGGAYKMAGGELTLITARTYETSAIEPMEYPEFAETVYCEKAGGYIIGYTPEKQTYRELHLYFRWIPINNTPGEQFLVVGGVSKYSIVSQISIWVYIGQWLSIGVTFILNCWLIALFVRNGDDPEGHEEGKRRGGRRKN